MRAYISRFLTAAWVIVLSAATTPAAAEEVVVDLTIADQPTTLNVATLTNNALVSTGDT